MPRPLPALVASILFCLIAFLLQTAAVRAQAPELAEGAAIATQFSGVVEEPDDAGGMRPVIDVSGVVARVLDVTAPGVPAQGQHWRDEPQTLAVRAGEVGQVFGIAYDDAEPANIYLTATAAFGLHRDAEGEGWMAGMWGPEGGPGTVWKLDAEDGYTPEVFARIMLADRPNTGAALGNIAFDPWSRQFYVSDLETGHIHRLDMNGTDLGTYDHGLDGRARFVDAATGEEASLPFVAFDPESRPRVADCPDGDFAATPGCWNIADFRRRVWGVGVRRDPAGGQVRLYYSVWSSRALGSAAFTTADAEEKTNTVWSVAIGPGGGFETGDVRREFTLPAFFTDERDIAVHGLGQPVSDIAFARDAEPGVMLVAERGGLRNLGLAARAAFTHPHTARVLRYEQDAEGVWQPAGRYDVGYYDRDRLGPPHVRANAAGGVDFGYGYDADGRLDTEAAATVVWMSGDALCTADAPCRDPESGAAADRSEVHGVQGTPGDAAAEVVPEAALEPYPASGTPTPAEGPDRSYMIDLDVNVDDSGAPIAAEAARSDASRIGDVEIYRPYPEDVAVAQAGPPFTDWGIPEDAADAEWWPEPFAEPEPGEALPAIDLAVQKAIPAACAAGELCGFVIIVTNTGATTYAEPITIVDDLANDWTLAGWGPAGADWTCAQTGTQVRCTHPAPDLAPGEVGVLNLDLQVPADQVAGAWENCAILDFGAAGGDDDPTNDQDCAPLAFDGDKAEEEPLADADLGIDKAAPHAGLAAAPGTAALHTCAPGVPCTFTVTITNAGTVAYEGVFRFIETMPPGWSFANAGPGWWCLTTAGGGPLVSCWRDVSLQPGQTESVDITLMPPATAPGEPTQDQNCVAIDWSQAERDGNADNDEACMPTILGAGAPDLRIVKEGPAQCARGEVCAYTITIRNVGTTTYTGPIDIRDRFYQESAIGTVPNTMDSYSSTGSWTCSGVGSGTLACTSPNETLAPGDAHTIQIRLALGWTMRPEIDRFENCAEITASTGDINTSNDGPSCVQTPLKPEWDLAVMKSGPGTCWPDAVGSCKYTINVVNLGKSVYEGPFTIDERTVKGLGIKLKDYTHSPPWLCKDAGDGLIRCEHPNTVLQPGQPSSGLNIEVTLPASIQDNLIWIVDCARVIYKGGQADANPDNDEKCVSTDLRHGAQHVVGQFVGGEGTISNSSFAATSSPDCTPPNCSYYAFTLTQRRDTYRGPLSIDIKAPPRSDFPAATISEAPASCPVSGWSCAKKAGAAGDIFTCRIAECRLAPGDRVIARIDGKVAPQLTEPPRIPLKKTACAILEWIEPGETGQDIEQRGGRRTKSTCATITVLARQRPATSPPVEDKVEKPTVRTCGPNEVASGGRCVCRGGFIRRGGRCMRRVRCRAPFVLNARGTACVCPDGLVRRGKTCVEPVRCDTRTTVKRGNACVCRYPNMRKTSATTCGCARRGQRFVSGRGCVPVGPKCDTRTTVKRGNACVCRYPGMRKTSRTTCGCARRGQQFVAGRGCVYPPCPDGQYRRGGVCVWKPCTRGRVRVGAKCVCPRGTAWIRNRCRKLEVIQPGIKGKTKKRPQRKVRPKIRIPKLHMICPKGTVWSPRYKRCIRRVQ